MPHVMTVSALALLSTISAVIGTHLGRDAIAQINPIFFSELPESHVYIDDAPIPFRLGTPDPVRADTSWSNVFNVGGRPMCLDCPANFVDPLYAAAEPASREPRRNREWEDPSASFERPTSSRELDRYSSFPVTEQEARLPYEPEAYAVRPEPQSESGPVPGQPIGM